MQEKKTTTKETVLSFLKENFATNKHSFISGEEIASKLNISRAAVCKAVNSLKKDGYDIRSKTKNGYKLQKDCCEKLNIKSLEKNFEKITNEKVKCECFNIISSTNIYAKSIAQDAPAPYLIAAAAQTQGKGRLGRSFFSPDNHGVYFSLILKPNLTLFDVSFITLIAAISVHKILSTYCQKELKIKWPNDILCENKKMCGILTECSATGENNSLQYAVVGIGLNLSGDESTIPGDLKNIMTTAQIAGAQTIDKNVIIPQIVKDFLKIFDNGNFINKKSEIIKEYKKYLAFLNEKVNVICYNEKYEAKIIDVDKNGRLIVEKDGELITVCSGEISIKPVV
ncbi:MAG: biotin--[acetyl-CoA-carboxylase] ligase [Oscillospiraceae bacterium]